MLLRGTQSESYGVQEEACAALHTYPSRSKKSSPM